MSILTNQNGDVLRASYGAGVRRIGTTVAERAHIIARPVGEDQVEIQIDTARSSAGVTAAIVFGAGKRVILPSLAPVTFAWSDLLNDASADRVPLRAAAIVGVDVGKSSPILWIDRGDVQEPEPEINPRFLTSPVLTLSGNPATEGNTLTITAHTYADANESQLFLERRAPSGDVVTAIEPQWAAVPDLTADIELRLRARIRQFEAGMGPEDGWYERTTPWVLVRALGTEQTLVAADVDVLRSDFIPGDPDDKFRPVVKFPGLEGKTIAGIQWSTVRPTATPQEADWHPMAAVSGETGAYTTAMTGGVTPDVSGFLATQTARLADLRFRWRSSALQPWSLPSPYFQVPIPDAPAAGLAAPTTAMVAEVISRNFVDWDVTRGHTGTDGTGMTGNHRGSHSATTVALASFLGDKTVYANGRTAQQRTIDQLRRWADTGRMPARGSGYPAQYSIDYAATLAIAKMDTPVWSALTNNQKAILTIAAEAMFVESAYEISNNNYWLDNGQTNRTFRGYRSYPTNPNYRTPPQLICFLLVPFLGGVAAAQDILDTWTVADMLQRMTDLGGAAVFRDVWEQFNNVPWTLAKLKVKHPNGIFAAPTYVGTGPTAAQIQSSLRNWATKENGYTIGQATEQLVMEGRRSFSKTIKPGFGPNPTGERWGLLETGTGSRNRWVGRLFNMNVAAQMPYFVDGTALRTGHCFEFDSTDAEGRRSASEYVLHGFRAYAVAAVAMIAQGQINPDGAGMGGTEGLMQRARRGTAALRFIVQVAGYEDRSKSGAPEDNPNDSRTPADYLADGWLPESICGLVDHCIDAWYFG